MAEPLRTYQLWEYSASHGHALVRSPRSDEHPTNSDIVFYEVEYLALPRHLGWVELLHAMDDEHYWAELQLGRPVDRARTWVLASDAARHVVVAARAEVSENSLAIFDTPFE